MILGAFLALCAAGAILGVTFRSRNRLGQAIGIFFLAAAGAAALVLASSEPVTVGDVQLSVTSYAAAFLAVGVAACLLLCLVGTATQPPAQLAPAALAALGGFGVALTSADPRVSLLAGTAAVATGSLTLLHHPAGVARDGRLAEIRILGVVTAGLLLAALVVLRPAWTGHEERAMGVGFLALVFAVAVRSGIVPFHVPAAHLARNVAPTGSALLLVLIPAGLGMLALAWTPFAVHVNTDWMNAGIALLQAVAVATILLGGLAALVHDRVDEVASYSIVSDAGFILLALAARSEAAAEPARLWLLVFVAAKTGLVAWVAASSRAMGSPELAQMRGWLRRTPLLGLCLIGIVVATLGWPGSAVAVARGDLVRIGLPGALGWVGSAAVILPALYYGRLLIIGLLRPTESARQAWSERPRLGFALRKATPAVAAFDAEAVAVAVVPAPVAVVPAPVAVVPAPVETSPNAVQPNAVSPVEPAAVVEPVEDAKPKRKRRTKAAALSASEPMPTTSAEVPGDRAEPPAVAAASEPAPTELSKPDQKALVLPRPKPRGPSLRHRLGLIWRLNRTLEVSLVVLAAAGLSLVVASGSFGTANAARQGIPLGTAAHATSSPTPVPSLPPTQAPLATGTPFVTESPSGSAGPSLGPSSSATPEHSAAPTTVIK